MLRVMCASANPHKVTEMVDLMGGQIVALMESLPTAIGYFTLGRMRPLAVSEDQRSSSLPDVPTFREAGFQEVVTTNWFGFSATAPNIGGSGLLRHLGLANVSYVLPAGKGLTVQGGIFGSVIGYDSLYARDNLNYTRPWGADFTPYLMLVRDLSNGMYVTVDGRVSFVLSAASQTNINGARSYSSGVMFGKRF